VVVSVSLYKSTFARNEMRLCAQLSALGARLDRMLQSADSAMADVQDIVLLQKEELGEMDSHQYIRNLWDANQYMRLYRTALVALRPASAVVPKIPCTWTDPFHNVGNKWCTFDKADFPLIYMVFGEDNANYLLLMMSLPCKAVLKASLKRIERHSTKSVLKKEQKFPSVIDMLENPDDDISSEELITEVSNCTVSMFLAVYNRFESGISYDTPTANNCYKSEIEGSHVVLVFLDPRPHKPGEFRLTYELPIQPHAGWSRSGF
jgi:hypothetical protein